MVETLANELKSGNPIIDFQHRLLLQMMKKLKSGLKSDRGEEMLLEAVQFLDCYIIEHFSDEEEIQRECSYPFYERHKEHHDQMRKIFGEFKIVLEKRGPSQSLLIEALGQLSKWFREHLNKEDMGFIQYYRDFHKIKV
jgi:hemerythrin